MIDEAEALRKLREITGKTDDWQSSLALAASFLEHPSAGVQAKALWRLGEIGLKHPGAMSVHVPQIGAFLSSENELLRERSLNALGRIGRGDWGLVKPYLPQMRLLAADSRPSVRLAFIWACENIGTNAPGLFEDDLPLFASLLDDENHRVRMEAPEIFRVLGNRIPEIVAPYRTKLLKLSENDENPVVRIHAAGAVRAMDKGAEGHTP